MCSVVIVEGDPHPGATKGRMSFQNFNPAIDVSIRSCDLKSFQRLFTSCASIVAFVLLISKPCLGRNWMMQPTLVSQQSLPPVLTIKVKKIVGGLFDPLNSLELFYSISSLYDLCRIVHTALELILDIYLQPLEIGIK